MLAVLYINFWDNVLDVCLFSGILCNSCKIKYLFFLIDLKSLEHRTKLVLSRDVRSVIRMNTCPRSKAVSLQK